MPPHYLSSLISRTRCKFFTEEGTPLANKIGASIAVGGMRYGGQELTMHNIWGFYFVHNMIVVNSEFADTETGVKACYWGAGGIANHKGDIDKDTEGKLVAEALGRRGAKITCAIQGMADKLVPTRFGEKF
jgi:multimeric flavodoxin WrbA